MSQEFELQNVEDTLKIKSKSKKGKHDRGIKAFRKKRMGEVKFRRAEKNYWPHKSHYYFFMAMSGNGPDLFPYMICFAFEISGGLFILTYLLSAYLFAMPLIYMEIFMGRYTELTNSQMYRMAPIFFGFGVTILLMNMLYIPINMVNASHFFIYFLKLMIETELFKSCPEPSMLCYGNSTDLKDTLNISSNLTICEHGDYHCPIEKGLKYVTEYNYWMTFKSDSSVNYPIWQLIISLIVTWFFIGTFLILGLKVIGAILKACTICCWFVFLILFIMAMTVAGGAEGLKAMISIEYGKFNIFKCLIIVYYTVGKLGFLIPTGHMTASAYAKFPKRLQTGAECLLIVTSNVFISIFYMMVLFAVGGVLAEEFETNITGMISPLTGLFLATITQFLTVMKAPISFILCYLFFFWFLQVLRTTIVIHLIVLNLYDYLPQLSYFPNYVVMSIVGICGVTSLLSGIHFFVRTTELLAATYIVLCLQAHIFFEAFCVFCCYGVKRLCDDIHFLTGRKPMKFWAMIWYIIPITTLMSFVGIIFQTNTLQHIESVLAHKALSKEEIYCSAVVLCFTLLVSFAASFLYVILSFRNTNANLLKPQFYWGPTNREIRISRKSFAPRTSIRSQPPRKKKQRFRVRSIRQMHEKDIAEKVKRGRIFVDTMYFKNVSLQNRLIRS